MGIVASPKLPLDLPEPEAPRFHYDAEDWDDRKIEQIVRTRYLGGMQKPKWRYKVPRDYNGADGLLRIDGWTVQWGAVRMGLIPTPMQCSVCQTRQGRMQYHNENYYRPAAAKPVCPSCHQKLHKRFDDPKMWKAHADQCAYEGAWFLSIATKRELTQEEAFWLAKRDQPWNAYLLVDFYLDTT